jgi:hypothetical protein
MVMNNNKYSDEERAAIFARAREVIEAASATLAKPRPHIAERVESRSERWRREADEQAARIAAERAKSEPLTEWEAAQLEHRLTGLVGEQKEFVLQIVAGCIAELRHEFDQKVAELNAEIGQLRAEATIAKAYSKTEPGGEVVDLPAWTRKTA